jgi:hypothetical protein
VEAAGAAAGLAGVASFKMIGWLAGMGAIGAGLASLVVMCTMTPRSPKEWAVGLVSTVVGSMCGGSWLVKYFGIGGWAVSAAGELDYFGLMAIVAIAFAAGLPAWALVRWTFNYINKRADADITEVAADAAEAAKNVKQALP